MSHKKEKRIATLDFETDPFLHGRVPTPFACGFYDGETYHQTWGDDCAREMILFLERYPEPLLIYAHNGGKFDFCYLEPWIGNPLQFINTRLVKAQLGRHELRDSYAIIPEPLSALQKDEVDYAIFEYGERDIPANKKIISNYLKSDCVYLHGFVTRFIETFGLNLTIAGTALKYSKRYHPFEVVSRETDAMLRPFYAGGRVQCFERGEIIDDLEYIDINSSYPDTMKHKLHPVGRSFATLKVLPENGFPYFAEITADSDGALPVRGSDGLSFPVAKKRRFFACSHEIETAQELGLLRIQRVHRVYQTLKCLRFDTFVDECMKGKVAATEAGDKVMRTFWKLLANSSYGKYAQDSTDYRDAMLIDSREALELANAAIHAEGGDEWEIDSEFGSRLLVTRPAQRGMIYNVGTAASITSGARSTLLRAIASAERPIYCDTDSLICRTANVERHPTKLGAWDVEATLDRVYVAGKKLYAGYKDGECIKIAAKGIDLKGDWERGGEVIQNIVRGIPYTNHRMSPTMKVFQEPRFITRTVRMT